MIDWNDYIGRGFHIGGRGPQEFDCYGLAKEIAKNRGYFLPEQDTPESVDCRLAIFQKEICPYLEPIERPLPYCLVVFDFRGRGLHIGTVTDRPGRFIHCSSSTKRVVVSKLKDINFNRHIYGFYRLTNKNPVTTAAS
jgi:hypothetical protein